MIRSSILLVDDHPMLRNGVAQLIGLEDNLQVAAQADNGEQAISEALRVKPDLVLLDLNMKGMSGIDTLIALKRAEVTAKVVIFSVSDNKTDVVQALKFGADGYLLKDSEPEELILKISKALMGEMVLSEPLTQIVARSLQANQPTNPIDNLTQREFEILRSIAAGNSNKVIANNLGITEGTVKVHVKNMLRKLGLKTRVEAAVWAVEQNLTR